MQSQNIFFLNCWCFIAAGGVTGQRASVAKYRIHKVTEQSMMYLQHHDITECIVKGILNKDDNGNLIEKHEKFYSKV